MDTSYGVGVRNRYDLLVDDDDDPLDILLEAEKRRIHDDVAKKNAVAPVKKDAVAPAKKDAKPKPQPKEEKPSSQQKRDGKSAKCHALQKKIDLKQAAIIGRVEAVQDATLPIAGLEKTTRIRTTRNRDASSASPSTKAAANRRFVAALGVGVEVDETVAALR